MEIYQWLFRQNGFKVSDIGYFVYVNAKTNVDAFNGKLEFDIKVLPYTGKDGWIEVILTDIKACLEQDTIPVVGKDCEYCPYREASGKKLQKLHADKHTSKRTKSEPKKKELKEDEQVDTGTLF